jgi:hypothetical protein
MPPTSSNRHARVNNDPVFRRAYLLREIEAETGIPVSTLRSMIRRGELNPITGFGKWLIAREEYERLLAKRLRN